MSRDVLLAYLHPNEVAASFHRSLFDMVGYDSANNQRLAQWDAVKCAAGGIPTGRNMATETLLDTDLDWIFFIDSDMGFAPDTLDRLLETADPTNRPVVGGLAFAYRERVADGMGGMICEPLPTIFDLLDTDQGPRFTARRHYPVNALVECSATGAACLLIHRSVIEKIHDQYGPKWFDRIELDNGDLQGEDISFCARVAAVGASLHVHTGIRTTHMKNLWVQEATFWNEFRPGPATIDTDVLVPVMERPGNAEPFMKSLRASTGLAHVTAIANRDDTETANAWRAAGADVLEIDGTTFAEKINAAFRHTERPVLFVCGDDVQFHPGWLDHAQFIMGAYRSAVVGTNDAGNPRVIRGEHATHLLIARQYVEEHGASFDGPGTVCHEGYRHWYVDDEIVAAARARGVFGMALGSIVEHLHPIFGKADDDPVYELGQSHAAADQALWLERAAEHLASPSAGGPVPLSSSGGGAFTGTVADGYGAAAHDFKDGAYDHIRFGFDPYPGTLNVHCDDTPNLGDPVHQFDLAGQTISLWPGAVDDHPVWIQAGDARPGWVIELIAPVRMRDRYETGDDIVVHRIGR